MVKMMIAARRKPGMTHAEYLDYLRVTHGGLAAAQPNGVLRYVQNHVDDSAYSAAADTTHGALFSRDSVAELYYESPAAMAANFAHPYTQEVIVPDGKKFADVSSNLVVVASETDLPVTAAGIGAFKVMHYLKKREGIALDTFLTRLADDHLDVIRQVPALAQGLRRHVQARALPPKPGAGGPPPRPDSPPLPSFDAVDSLFFDSAETRAQFGDYQRALMHEAGGPGGYLDASAGFYLYVHEVEIFDLTGSTHHANHHA